MNNLSNILVAMSMFLSSAAIAQNDVMKKQSNYPAPDSMKKSVDKTVSQDDSMRTRNRNPQYDRKTEMPQKIDRDTVKSHRDNRY